MEVNNLPIISQFQGILIKMFYDDNKQHNIPHIHAQYCEFNGVFDLKGNLMKLNNAKEITKTYRSMDRNT